MHGKISQDVTVPFKPSILIPGVDMTLVPGTQNINILAGTLATAGASPLYYVVPQQFGAVADGVHDDTAAIQSAINQAQTVGWSLYFPGTTGFYRVTGTLAITGPLSVYGNPNTSTVKTTSTTADVVSVAGNNVLIDGLRFGAITARAGGSYINMPAAVGGIRISRCFFDHAWVGITSAAAGTSIIDIEDCYFFDTVSSGVGVRIQGGFEIRLRHIVMNSGASPQPLAGVLINACGDVTLEDVNIIQHQDCLALLADDGKEIDSVLATDCYFDTSSASGLVAGTTGSGSINRCRFIGCWFSSHGNQGVVLTGHTDTIEFIDCHCFLNGTGGFYFLGLTNFTMIGCQVAGNGGAAVYVGTGATNVTMIGNTLMACAGFGPNAYGIFFNGAYNGVMVVSGNRMIGNSSGAIAGPSPASFILNSNQIIRDNPGFIDHASGSGLFPSGATSTAITHGLSGTPDLAGILLTMRSGMGGTPGLYVSAVSATTFTVSASPAPSAPLNFTWQARL